MGTIMDYFSNHNVWKFELVVANMIFSPHYYILLMLIISHLKGKCISYKIAFVTAFVKYAEQSARHRSKALFI